MSARVVEPMADAAQWVATGPDGATPSVDLAIHDEQVVVGYGADAHSGRVTATARATGHLLRRTIAAVNVAGAAELRLSIRSDRVAGAEGGAFFLELRLGSAALAVSDPANTWHRLLPVRAKEVWHTVRLSLDDLPPAVAEGVTQLQLRCVDARVPFTAYLDDVIAVTPQMLVDADRALEARLGGITVGGSPIAAAVRSSAQPAPTGSALDIVQFDLRYAPDRVRDMRRLRDFTASGARLVPLGDPYTVDYAITPVAPTRAAQAALLEAVVARLAPFDELSVDGETLPTGLVWIAGWDRTGGAAGDVPVLYYRVGVRRPVTAGPWIREVRELHIESDQLAGGATAVRD
ncbi:hypothetical protein [Streptomyces melanogenes]|uniref:hypothetical protein n=1 Tax=Streptomyces melanogenes TaxID=67326 RepID=UPI00379E424D